MATPRKFKSLDKLDATLTLRDQVLLLVPLPPHGRGVYQPPSSLPSLHSFMSVALVKCRCLPQNTAPSKSRSSEEATESLGPTSVHDVGINRNRVDEIRRASLALPSFRGAEEVDTTPFGSLPHLILRARSHVPLDGHQVMVIAEGVVA